MPRYRFYITEPDSTVEHVGPRGEVLPTDSPDAFHGSELEAAEELERRAKLWGGTWRLPRARTEGGTHFMNHDHVDIYSGIGGFSLAAEWAGFRTVAFAELDPEASIVLAHHWPHVPNYGDVTRIDYRKLRETHGEIALITAGFPCQPFSLLGTRMGCDDPRFHWHEITRAIREARPKFCVLENVPGLLSIGASGIGLREWDNRWRGLHHSAEGLSPEGCFSNSPSRDERERAACDFMVAQEFRGSCLQVRTQKAQGGTSITDCMEASRKGGDGVHSPNPTVSDFETSAGRCASEAGYNDGAAQGRRWTHSVDSGLARWRGRNREIDSQSERARRAREGVGDKSILPGRIFGRICRDLAALGYDVLWGIVPAACVGAGHLRERVIIVASDSAHDGERTRERLQSTTGLLHGADGHASNGNGSGWGAGRAGRFAGDHEGQAEQALQVGDADLDHLHADSGGLGSGKASFIEATGRHAATGSTATRDLRRTTAHTAGEQVGSAGQSRGHSHWGTSRIDLRGRAFGTSEGEPPWWHEAHTGIPVLANGIPSRLAEAAARCTGNSIVPEAVYPILKALREAIG